MPQSRGCGLARCCLHEPRNLRLAGLPDPRNRHCFQARSLQGFKILYKFYFRSMRQPAGYAYFLAICCSYNVYTGRNPVYNIMPQPSVSTPSPYRPNVAMVLCNPDGKVLVARRISHDGWQFPQGGIKDGELAKEASYRELREELGIGRSLVRLIGESKSWFKYDIPQEYLRNSSRGNIRGQIQKWFLFEYLGCDEDFRLDYCAAAEFDEWKWIDYWGPVDCVVEFKRSVYSRALGELEPFHRRSRA